MGAKKWTDKLTWIVTSGEHTLTAWLDGIHNNGDNNEANDRLTVNLTYPKARPEYFPEPDKADNLVMVIVEGWGTSGKGSLIGRILRYLDPRGARMYSITQPTGEEARKPAMNRFWLTLPAKGEIAVYDRSWYHDWMTIGKPWKQKEIEIFERQLTDDGYVIFKFFLHISKKEQKKRLKELESSRSVSNGMHLRI